MSKVKDVDRGYKDLLERAKMHGVIKVGILTADADKAYDDAVTVLQVAMWNEFGTEHIPERSFLRAWFDENESKCREAVKRMASSVLAGKYKPEQALQLVAQRFVGEIQKRMAQGVPPPNAASTIARKGSDKPLIDTGQLRSSISYVVEPK